MANSDLEEVELKKLNTAGMTHLQKPLSNDVFLGHINVMSTNVKKFAQKHFFFFTYNSISATDIKPLSLVYCDMRYMQG